MDIVGAAASAAAKIARRAVKAKQRGPGAERRDEVTPTTRRLQPQDMVGARRLSRQGGDELLRPERCSSSRRRHFEARDTVRDDDTLITVRHCGLLRLHNTAQHIPTSATLHNHWACGHQSDAEGTGFLRAVMEPAAVYFNLAYNMARTRDLLACTRTLPTTITRHVRSPSLIGLHALEKRELQGSE